MVALLKTLLPLFLLLDSTSPVGTLKASGDEDSWCVGVNTWLPLPSLFEHSLPTLSLITLEEAHSKLLLRLVAEEVEREVEEEEFVDDMSDVTDADDVENEEDKEEE